MVLFVSHNQKKTECFQSLPTTILIVFANYVSVYNIVCICISIVAFTLNYYVSGYNIMHVSGYNIMRF